MKIRMTWPQYLRNECIIVIGEHELPVRMQPQQADILFLMLVRHPNPVPLVDVIEFLYPNPDDEGDDAGNLVHVRISQLNRKFGRYIIRPCIGIGYRLCLP